MKIFLAGATGVVGQQLVPQLVELGHDVVGTTRTQAKAGALRDAGATPVVLDVLDGDAVRAAVVRAAPDVVIHQATALTNMTDLRHWERTFALTNRLRTVGTDNLLAAAQAAGASRFIAQSYAGWPNARVGGPVKTEDDPLDPDPPEQLRTTLEAIRYVEAVVPAAEGLVGIVLRYGGLYGPDTSLWPGGEQYEMVRKRRFPLVGEAGGVWSFTHTADAAAAAAVAVERGEAGIYNAVDDEPARVAEWLPYLARALGAKPPRRVPVWLGRLMAGDHMVTMLTDIRGSSNAKARRELGWTPSVATWRDGFAAMAAAGRA